MTTRADMAGQLPLTPKSPARTYVLEIHSEQPAEDLTELAEQARLEPTEDAYLYVLRTPEGMFWVDQLDERFWSFHTTMPTAYATPYLNKLINARRDLDWMWLPSGHLRHMWPGAASQRVRAAFDGSRLLGESAMVRDVKLQLSGRNAEALLDHISEVRGFESTVSFDGVQVSLQDPALGSIQEAVHRTGRFAVSGDSLEFHLQFVRTVVQRYRALVDLCEEHAIRWSAFDRDLVPTGATFTGSPITIEFSHAIADRERFLGELFSCREPFRLWGTPRTEGELTEVEAVDLHVGDQLSMDIGRDWLRVYLYAGACGNTVARLVSNLQHRFDGALRFADPRLQQALRDDREPAVAPAT